MVKILLLLLILIISKNNYHFCKKKLQEKKKKILGEKEKIFFKAKLNFELTNKNFEKSQLKNF